MPEPVGAVGEAGAFQGGAHGLFVLGGGGGPGPAVRDASEAYDVLDGQLDLRVDLLLDHGQSAGDLAAGQVGHGAAVQGDDPGTGFEQTGLQPQQG